MSPFDSEDAKSLLKSAIRDPDPVVFLESELMYGQAFDVSDEVMDKDYLAPLGKAKVQRSGRDITIASFSMAMMNTMKAAETLAKEGISTEVINLRSIRPLDIDTINESVQKTHHLMTVESKSLTYNYNTFL